MLYLFSRCDSGKTDFTSPLGFNPENFLYTVVKLLSPEVFIVLSSHYSDSQPYSSDYNKYFNLLIFENVCTVVFILQLVNVVYCLSTFASVCLLVGLLKKLRIFR